MMHRFLPTTRLARVLLPGLLVVPLLWAVHAWRFKAGADELALHASQRLALLAASLDAELLRFESLPPVLAQHPSLQQLLQAPDDPARVAAANALLEQVNERTGAGMLYLIDPAGRTLAASNWRRADSFVGENYAFRPYFRDALAGGAGKFFAVGATTQVPGFFIAHPVRAAGRITGVLAVKVELTQLEATWAAGGESVLVVDRHGVVALSSNPAWKFGTLAPLSPESRAALAATRQYFTAALEALPLVWREPGRARLGGQDYVVGSRALDWVDWRMLMLLDTAPVRAAAWSAVLAVGLALCVLAVAGLYWALHARRLRERLAAQAELERTVAERTADLATTNAQLLREISERSATEQKLRGAQRALIEANRLAALGQMAAGVAHELNQPLAALRSFAGNSLTFLDRGRLEPLRDNLNQIIGLIERMARLTAQLKVFASRQQTGGGSASAAQAMQVVAGWFRERLDAAGVELRIDAGAVRLPLQPQALEQVLSNLVGNALDALAGRDGGVIALGAARHGTQLCLEVADNGPGIPQELRERITQPFFSTKPLGQGLGLGLSIVSDLIEGSGGRLEIESGAGGGTVMRACWPEAAGTDGAGEGRAGEAE
ncbi:sensor histidine kinase [Thauera chlorobenzoica]|uniref:C4-dicarboxylate transport sensor protein DctB n=1 Tax=Thauera chlorobenzoica TaxID=96773 RepID=A0A1L6FFV0_9RHOO|nr:ATP-binding protein [Thauera chlorobenzoica]APR05801.1 Signal transduction histidine kinase [Thauera chlorobenzoica]